MPRRSVFVLRFENPSSPHGDDVDVDTGAPSSGSGTGMTVRAVVPEDAASLAELMYESYRGSIDDRGETREDAVEELAKFFAGEYGPPLLDRSFVALGELGDDGESTPLSAVLTTRWGKNRCPLIAFVMTRPELRRSGLAANLLRRSIEELAKDGEEEVRGVVTEGNIPSERLFARLGFDVLISFEE